MKKGMGAVATLCAAGAMMAASTTDASAQSSRWEYYDTRRGGIAYSCWQGPRREICMVLFCGPRGRIRFGLEGLSERNDRPRDAVVRIGGFSTRVTFTLERGLGRGNEIWEVRPRRPGLARRLMKQARDMEILIEPRRRSIPFTLRGSSRAITALEDRCYWR